MFGTDHYFFSYHPSDPRSKLAAIVTFIMFSSIFLGWGTYMALGFVSSGAFFPAVSCYLIAALLCACDGICAYICYAALAGPIYLSLRCSLALSPKCTSCTPALIDMRTPVGRALSTGSLAGRSPTGTGRAAGFMTTVLWGFVGWRGACRPATSCTTLGLAGRCADCRRSCVAGRCDMTHLTPRPALPLVLRARTFQFAISGALMPAIYTLGNWPHTVWTVDGWEPTVCNDPPFQVDWVRKGGVCVEIADVYG